MAASSAIVPIIVAGLGVLGALVPLFISAIPAPAPAPALFIDFNQSRLSMPSVVLSRTNITIGNNGSSPATNLSLTLMTPGDSFISEYERAKIEYIINDFSATQILYNNTVLEPGEVQYVNRSSINILVPKLVPGLGSVIRLIAVTNTQTVELKAVYDQGSDQVRVDSNKPYATTQRDPLYNLFFMRPFEPVIESLGANAVLFAILYYVLVVLMTYLMIRRVVTKRKRIKSFPIKLAYEIISIRSTLRNDPAYDDIFYRGSQTWFWMTDEERRSIDIKNDYLLFEDFYHEMVERNSYLTGHKTIKESGLSKANALRKYNEDLLTAAENVLNTVDWNKYR